MKPIFIELLNILFQSPERSASELLEEEQFLGKPSEEEGSLFQEFEL